MNKGLACIAISGVCLLIAVIIVYAGEPSICDLNDDADVDYLDVSMFVSYLDEGNMRIDFNNDSMIDDKDIKLIIEEYKEERKYD